MELCEHTNDMAPLTMCLHAAKHYTWTRLPYPVAVLTHSLHNLLVLTGYGHVANVVGFLPMCLFGAKTNDHAKPATLGHQFMEHYYSAIPATDNGEDFCIPNGRIQFEPELCLRPRRAISTAILPDQNPEIGATPMQPWMSDVTPKPSTPWTLIHAYHGVFLQVCENNDHNLYSVLRTRVLKAPPLDPVTQEIAWTTILNPIFEAIMPHPMLEIERSHLELEWFNHFTDSTHKRRFARAMVEIRRHSVEDIHRLASRTKTQIKCNEAVLKPNDDYKFRNLQNVNEIVQTAVGPEMFGFYKRFKEWFNQDNVFTIPGYDFDWMVTLTYAGAYNDVDLTLWMKRALSTLSPGTIHIIASGDDVLIIICDQNGVVTIWEVDAVQFDQSQGQGVLKFENGMMRRFGVSSKTIAFFQTTAKGKLVAAFGALGWGNVWILDFGLQPKRVTGNVTTSSGNSTSSLASSAAVFTQFPPSMPVLERYAALGFKVKLKSFTSVDRATFLKGMWYHTTDGLHWGPLPSRILKIGKSVTPIYHLFADLRHRLKNRPQDFLDAACRRFVQEVLMGYRNMIRVPLLGDMCAMWPRAGGRMHIDSDKYTVQAGAAPKPILTHQGLVQVCQRYDVTEEELKEAAKLLPSGPFEIIDHRVFRQLAIVDYY